MFASEYSASRSPPLRNRSISRCSPAMSFAEPRSAASRAAMLSRAAMTVTISTISRLVLRTTKMPPWPGADKAFLLEHGHRLADRRAADAEPLREPPLVQPDLLRMLVYLDCGDRPL